MRKPFFGSSAALQVSTTGHFHNSLQFGTQRKINMKTLFLV